jgi:hypothetical protein
MGGYSLTGAREALLPKTGERVRYYCSILTARAGMAGFRKRAQCREAAVSEASLACASVQMIACAAESAILGRSCFGWIGIYDD